MRLSSAAGEGRWTYWAPWLALALFAFVAPPIANPTIHLYFRAGLVLTAVALYYYQARLTGRKEALKSHETSVANLGSALWEAVPEGLILLDRSSRITLINTSFEKHFGYSRSDI